MTLLTAVFRDDLTILILLHTVQSGWGVLVKPGVAVITSIDDSENHLSVKYIVDIFPTGTSTVWFGLRELQLMEFQAYLHTWAVKRTDSLSLKTS